MIEFERQPEQARLVDGTWVSPDDALKTMAGIYRSLRSTAIPNRIANVLDMRVRIDDLESYAKDSASPNDPEGEYTRQKINETLMSHIFDTVEPDEKWTVPPHTALAVLRSMVVVDIDEDSSELYLQEPFSDRELLGNAWEASCNQR